MTAAFWLYLTENIGRAASFVFTVPSGFPTWHGSKRRTDIGMQRDRLLVQADQLALHRITAKRLFVTGQYAPLRVLNAPVVRTVGLRTLRRTIPGSFAIFDSASPEPQWLYVAVDNDCILASTPFPSAGLVGNWYLVNVVDYDDF
jgi:hypothetical protein